MRSSSKCKCIFLDNRYCGTFYTLCSYSFDEEFILIKFITTGLIVCLTLAGLAVTSLMRSSHVVASAPSTLVYTKDGDLVFPSKYREWVYLSSGINMSYSPQSGDTQAHSIFDNVFVNPEAYRSFLDSGTWPDKTVLVLENRVAQSKGSINHSGYYQSSTLNGVEAHVKDEARFRGKWAFFAFSNDSSGKLIPQSADCYSCHVNHGAVDTTFVQFYPTLLKVAEKKNTLSPAYVKEFHAALPSQ